MAVCILLAFVSESYGYENIALGKPAQQSSTHSPSWGAGNAVDGNKEAYLLSSTCAVSADNKTTAWWNVDLGTHLPIHHVSIIYRIGNFPIDMERYWESHFRGRFAGFFLYISNDTNKENGHLCYHEIQNGFNSPPPNMTIECVVTGRYVIYYNERDHNKIYPSYYDYYAYVDLCEVEVYGCSHIGQYGSDCRNCSIGCKSGICDANNGTCSSCLPGFFGNYCNESCPEIGQYGKDCLSCPTGCKYGVCDVKNGSCSSCLPGYLGDYCNESCSDGTYGDLCKGHCGSCRDGKPCDRVTGICLNGCGEGKYGDKCIEDCSLGYYGYDCNNTCSDTCVTPGQCNRYTGKCLGGCLSGYKGDQCDLECKGGLFGLSCNRKCGFCFHGDPCNHVNGSCLSGCSEGYEGDKCDDACEDGKYGLGCRAECSVFCKTPRSCHHVTGACLNGCKEGVTGSLCLNVEGPVFKKETVYALIGLFSILLFVNAVCTVVFIIRRCFLLKDGKNGSVPNKMVAMEYQNELFAKKETSNPYQEYQELELT